MDFVSPAAQLFGRGHPGGSAADNADGLVQFALRRDRFDPAAFERRVGNIFFHRSDGHRAVARLLDDAVAFAKTILRADAAADLRQVISCRRYFEGFFKASFGRQHQPVRDVVVDRTMDLAKWHSALGAAAGLLDSGVRVISVVDFFEIFAPFVRGAFFRHLLRDVDEFKHFIGHIVPSRVTVR